jgi:hypothetical protein
VFCGRELSRPSWVALWNVAQLHFFVVSGLSGLATESRCIWNILKSHVRKVFCTHARLSAPWILKIFFPPGLASNGGVQSLGTSIILRTRPCDPPHLLNSLRQEHNGCLLRAVYRSHTLLRADISRLLNKFTLDCQLITENFVAFAASNCFGNYSWQLKQAEASVQESKSVETCEGLVLKTTARRSSSPGHCLLWWLSFCCIWFKLCFHLFDYRLLCCEALKLCYKRVRRSVFCNSDGLGQRSHKPGWFSGV